MMKGWVSFRAERSEFRLWPISMLRGVRRSSMRFCTSASVVVTGSSMAGVIPEYLENVSTLMKVEMIPLTVLDNR